jgi:hypothetical protein
MNVEAVSHKTLGKIAFAWAELKLPNLDSHARVHPVIARESTLEHDSQMTYDVLSTSGSPSYPSGLPVTIKEACMRARHVPCYTRLQPTIFVLIATTLLLVIQLGCGGGAAVVRLRAAAALR